MRADGGGGPRFAIAGAGLMGRWHADAGERSGGRLVAICDPDASAASALAARHANVAVHPQLAKLLASEQPDVVHVCTPLEQHAEQIEQALAAAADVIAEKPLAATAGDTERLLGLAGERDRVLCPVHQLVAQPWLAEVARVGEILSLDYSACSAGASNAADDPDRVADDILPHPLSLFAALLSRSGAGRPRASDLGTLSWHVERPARGELRAQTATGGVALALAISLQGRPPRHELRVTGTLGTLHADLFHGFAWREGASTSRAYKVARPFWLAGRQLAGAAANLARRAARQEPAYPGLRELISQVYRCRAGGGPARAGQPGLAGQAGQATQPGRHSRSPIPPHQILAVARARDAILAAS